MADVFISYSHEDSYLAERFEEELGRLPGLSVWRDTRITPGSRFEVKIQDELRKARVCLVLMSHSYLASEYCQNEIGFAEANGTTIVPVRLDDCKPAGFLAARSYIDLHEPPNNYPLPRLFFTAIRAVRHEVTVVTQNDLRGDYLEMYQHLARQVSEGRAISWFRQVVTGAGVLWATLARERPAGDSPPYSNRYHPDRRFISADAAHAFCRSAINFLSNGGPCLWFLRTRHDFNHVPAWFFSSAQLAGKTSIPLSLMPDAVLLAESFDCYENDAMMDASVYAPFAREAHDSTHPYFETPFPILYDEINSNGGADLGWTGGTSPQYVFLLTKGVYRVERMYGAGPGSRLTLTRYLPLQSARLRLFSGSRDVESRPPSNTIQLMYLGYKDTFASGGKMKFLLYNDQQGIAVVSAIRAVVHAVSQRQPEPPPGAGAPLNEYRYSVRLTPQIGHVIVTDDQFKYAAGDIDTFTIDLESSAPGFDYEVSIAIDWVDVQTGRSHTLSTPRERVPFPLYEREQTAPRREFD